MEKASPLPVPLTTDPVAPCRLTYGRLSIGGGDEGARDRSDNTLFFEIRDADTLGRVTFEGLDAMRVSRGEVTPYDDGNDFSSWVYTVTNSRWLTERHEYESIHYQTPLLGSYQHYLFRFHDEFVEAIAEGLWIDVAPADEFVISAPHPMADDLPLDRVRTGTTDGLEWEVRRSTLPNDQLLRDSSLCSQRLFDFYLEPDATRRITSTCWVRTRMGRPQSHLRRDWLGTYASVDGVAQLDALLPYWEHYCRGVAARR